MEKLTSDFFDRDTVTVARELLGKHLVRVWGGVPLTVRITETEAYVGRSDKACHAYGYKRTKRTETLFAPPGTAEGEPAAVLIRAGEPVSQADADAISVKRFGCTVHEMSAYQRKNFLNGPGKLCKGLSLTTEQNGLSLSGDELYLLDSGERPETIHTGRRIGIDYAEEAADFPWRFYL